MVVTDFQPVLAAFLCERIGLVPSPHLQCIGSVINDQLRGVVGYDGFNGASCQMHVAGDEGWFTKTMLKAVFDYPFNVLGCNMVLGLVPSGNDAALRFNRHIGFAEVCRIEGGHPDGALVLMAMRREECRWLKMKADTSAMH